MNIFVTDKCPIKSAEFMDSKRMIKMILESAQLLNNAAHYYGLDAVYRKTHENHPCSVWARDCRENYLWLLDHFMALCKRYTKEYGKIHKCQENLGLFEYNAKFIPNNNNNNRTIKFINCTIFKDVDCVFTAYKMHLREKWKKL